MQTPHNIYQTPEIVLIAMLLTVGSPISFKTVLGGCDRQHRKTIRASTSPVDAGYVTNLVTWRV